MHRRVSILAAAVAALLSSSACQDYNFNPVGHCLIQPGTKRITVSKVSTADVLFVVDDSGSMKGEQTALATQFPRFLDVLARVNKERVTTDPPQDAFDFHVAVTTTSSYYNEPAENGSICSNQCPGAVGQNVCCLQGASGALASPQPPLCQSSADCAGGVYGCASNCAGLPDVNLYTGSACCDATGKAQVIPCSRPGESCGIFDRFFYDDGICEPGYPQSGRYPAGQFVANPANAAPNAGKVLHFDKDLPWETWDWTSAFGWGSTSAELQGIANAFSQNVQVGTCGSAQEQGLEVARRAIQATLGQGGLTQPGVAAGEWLHPDSKLVVVWVTDEDDCSAPYGAGGGVVFSGNATCDADEALADDAQRQYLISEYAGYFTSLGRPFGAAFIVAAVNGCEDASCTPLACTDPACTDPTPGTCGGQDGSTRYVQLANAFRERDAEATIISGSICDPFGDSLGRIARIVKPPDSLLLPTQPAASDVTILRIADSSGATLRSCSRPAPAAPAEFSPGVPWNETNAKTYVQALTAYDWWFTATEQQTTWLQRLPSAPSTYVYINHVTGRCEAGSGETYSVDYIGRIPADGCMDAVDCSDALGGQEGDWTCYAGEELDGTCTAPGSSNPGTCICGSFEKNCPNG